MVISSLPLVLLDPDQAPEALQLVALDEDQVMVMVVLSCTSLADAEILIVGVGVVVPPPPALPPPPPQALRIAVIRNNNASSLSLLCVDSFILVEKPTG